MVVAFKLVFPILGPPAFYKDLYNLSQSQWLALLVPISLCKIAISTLIITLLIFESRKSFVFMEKEIRFQVTLIIGLIFDLALLIIPAVSYMENPYKKG